MTRTGAWLAFALLVALISVGVCAWDGGASLQRNSPRALWVYAAGAEPLPVAPACQLLAKAGEVDVYRCSGVGFNASWSGVGFNASCYIAVPTSGMSRTPDMECH